MSKLKYVLYAGIVSTGIISAGAFSLYLIQDSIIYPSDFPEGKRLENNPPGFVHPGERDLPYSTVELKATDGVVTNAWLLMQPVPQTSPTVLFFHANAGNRGYRMPFIEEFYKVLGMNVLIIDYRGYGESDAPKSEKGIKLDAEAALKYLFDHGDINSDSIFVFGRSLGGAVAIYIAHKHPIKGLILENTFTSIKDVIRDSLGKFWVITWPLLKSNWASIDIIDSVKCPILFISGQNDSLIPPAHMRSCLLYTSDAADE